MYALDGFQIYGFFRAGSHQVNASRTYLDRINVFPVPDGDTGTNLCSTLSGALAATIPAPSASVTLGNLADATILSARGNSGVIFAQFVTGLSESIMHAEMRANDFSAGVHFAYLRAKAALTDPRDGTILSVIETWAASLARRVQETSNFVELIGSTREDLRRSLAETTEQLAELKDAGVVDAGAAGFVEFVAGGHEYLANGAKTDFPQTEKADAFLEEYGLDRTPEAAPTSIPAYRYCTEAIVTGDRIDAEAVRAALAGAGDCLIVAGGRKRTKIHVHTNEPAAVMESLARFGSVGGQKADDMRIQFADAHARIARTAIVTDSACDLSAALLKRHLIHVVPLFISANGCEYLDNVTLDAARLRVLSDGEGVFPRSSQPPAPAFARLFAILASHYDGVVAIHLSSKLSGTFEASRKEAAKTGGMAAAYDSKHLSGSLGLIVLRAAEAAESGKTQAEILSALPDWSAKGRIFVSVTSLRYMVKGGRVSPLKGLAAKILNLKPIVSVDGEGKSILFGKAFSEKANLKKIVEMAIEEHGRSPLKYYAVGHAGAPAKAAAVAAELEGRLGFPPVYIEEISAVIALNSGPGAVSVVTMRE